MERPTVKRLVPQFHPLAGERVVPQCGWAYEWGSGGWTTGYRADKLRAKGRDPHRCLRGSTMVVEGTPYCRTHAGERCLQLLEDGEHDMRDD